MLRRGMTDRTRLSVLLVLSSLALGTACSLVTSNSDTPEAPKPALDAAELRRAYSLPSAEWPKPTLDDGVAYVELGLVPKLEHPPENPWSKEKEALGKTLFFDARLSGTGEMACASCHIPELGFSDGRTTSFGHGFQPLPRNAPSILNSGFAKNLFWDGRADSLEAQASAVLANPKEMRTSQEHVEQTLRSSRGYREMFQTAFGDADPTLDRALAAIATFERTIVSDGSSDFDKFLKGDPNALSDAAVRGLHLFRTKARCANCHMGPRLTDDQFHEVGLSYYGRKFQDLGRYEITKDAQDVGRFRTPSLRNVTRTAPYMHNGLFELQGIVQMYDAGMPALKRKESEKDDPLFPSKSPLLKPLSLTAGERSDILEFLESLAERKRRINAPTLPAIGDVTPASN